MVRVLARSLVAVALLALGAAGGAALAARPDQAAVPTVASAPAPPVEVRTVVKRRTVHVYRKPHHPRPAPATASAPPAPAPAIAPAPAVAPPAVRVVQPTAPAHPLVTRTSGSGKGGGGEHEGGGEGEHDD